MIQRKTSLAAVTTIKSADKGEARVRFSTPDGTTPDKDRDITGPNAFTEGAQAVISPFGHRSITDGAIPAGRATIHRDGTADLKFFTDTPTGLETFLTLKGLGSITQYSYGFHIREEGDLTPAMRAAGASRYLKRLDVIELSPCVEGAGLNTATLDLKSCGCGVGSTCGCTTKQPSRAEREAIVAESLRLLAKDAKILVTSAETTEQLAARIKAGVVAVQAKYGCWTPTEVRVDPELRVAAVAHATWAAARLGIVPPAVKFFGRASAEGARARGLYYSDDHAIWIRDNLRSWDLAKTCQHECLHAARAAYGMPQNEVSVERETEALLTDYARELFYGK